MRITYGDNIQPIGQISYGSFMFYIPCIYRGPLCKVGRFSTRRNQTGMKFCLCMRFCAHCVRIFCAEFTLCTQVEVHIECLCTGKTSKRWVGRYGKGVLQCARRVKVCFDTKNNYLYTIKIVNCVLELCLGVHKNKLWHRCGMGDLCTIHQTGRHTLHYGA